MCLTPQPHALCPPLSRLFFSVIPSNAETLLTFLSSLNNKYYECGSELCGELEATDTWSLSPEVKPRAVWRALCKMWEKLPEVHMVPCWRSRPRTWPALGRPRWPRLPEVLLSFVPPLLLPPPHQQDPNSAAWHPSLVQICSCAPIYLLLGPRFSFLSFVLISVFERQR